MARNMLIKCSGRCFRREGKIESRVFCPCGLCRLRFGRMFLPWRGVRPGSVVILPRPGWRKPVITSIFERTTQTNRGEK